MAISALFFGLVVPISPAAAVVITVTASINDTTPEVGQTLTASATFSPTQGNPSAASYKWQSVTGSDPAVDIPGATSSTYTVTADMETKKLQVVITSTSGGPNTPGTGTSPQTSPVAKGNFTAQPTVTINDTTPQVDQTVTATATGALPSAGVTYHYQWYTITGSDPEVLVPGATNATFTAADTDLGKKLLVKAYASKAGYNDSNTVSSAATTAVAEATFTTPPSVAVSDTTPQVDQTVTANVTGTSPSSGVTYAYQWYVVDGANPEAPISGETSDSYTVGADDLGKTLLVKVIASKSGYTNSAEVSSAQTSPVAKADFDTPPSVTIDDTTPVVGETLTATPSGEDPTGDGYTYQWYSADGIVDPVAIDGATTSSYVVGAATVGTKIFVRVHATKTGYNDGIGNSAETDTVIKASFTTDPQVSISDTTPTVDQEVSAVLDTASDPVGTYVYQWYTVDGANPAQEISGANDDTYTVAAGDVGLKLQVKVTATKPGYNDAADTSAETSAVIKADFTGTLAATLSDTTPTEGQQLTANVSGVTPAPTGYTYQWKAGADNVGTNSATFTPGATEVGKTITVTVTATKPGYNDVTDTSPASSTVAAAVLLNFTTPATATLNTTAPKVGTVLTVTPSGEVPDTNTFSYQWYRISALGVKSAMVGEIGQNYTVTPGNLNYKLQAKVTAMKDGYNNRSSSSVQTDRVNQITLSKSTVARGSTITVTAAHLRSGQVYRIFIDGLTVYKGTVPSSGTVSRTVTVPTSIGTGSTPFRVSGYDKSGARDFTVVTSIPVT